MKGFCLEVSGDYACFTRPEMKVERVSYDVITPSAARGVFTAIFWKPAIRWRITKIEVLNPIRWTTVRRNEVSAVASPRSGGIYVEDARQQRAGLILRDVRYRIWAEFDMVSASEDPAKYAAMFDRRATNGQYFMHPYLGCREFSCKEIRLVKHPEQESAKPIVETRDLGFMLYDMDYSDLKDIKPMFYRPKMLSGVITVPHPDSEEVFK
ncbi:MAG: type I-C CRISPR-associated protein Cas5 [Kiritimatiellae bacterium]|nr:type I-C CRISPR-associated protein Cas5 [Kiritimatiellia bacterium]